jgi:alkanesulfonate monooxygenase SsuD/methylene tetrahydromethanopterin reductase-like flavin-dependent oxidoreductase (luciferase family)
MTKYGAFISDFPETKNNGKQYFNELSDYIHSLDNNIDSVWIPDHVAPYLGKPDNHDLVEAFTTISYLSAIHQNKTFGTMVVCNNFRNPALLAKMTATIATMTDNRFILGIGAGWYKKEYDSYGYDFSTGGRRVRQLDEAMQIITGMLTEEYVTFEGKHYQVKEAYCNPKPETPPKILVACHGEKYSLGIVARYADMWNINFPTPESYQNKLNLLSKFCEENDREYDDIEKTIFNNIAIANTQEEAKRLAKQSAWHPKVTLVGTPDNVISQMGEFIDIGVDYWMLGFVPYHNTESTRLFADEVIPELI